MPQICILICMRTTLNIDNETLNRAAELTGVREKTALVKLGLEALIARESSKRLAELGATEEDLRAIPRRRSAST
jgi:Arc/MetJ family transcription regulator